MTNTDRNITLSKNTEIRRLEHKSSTSSYDVQLKEQQHASVNTTTSSINGQSNFILNEHQKQNSANHFNSAYSEKKDQLKDKQFQQRVINIIELSGLTPEK